MNLGNSIYNFLHSTINYKLVSSHMISINQIYKLDSEHIQTKKWKNVTQIEFYFRRAKSIVRKGVQAV